MGGKQSSQLDIDDVDDYVALSFLTRRQVYSLFERFKQLDREAVGANKDARIPVQTILHQARDIFPEFKCNPFADRIFKVFSSEEDDAMSFEDFIDLASVFSEEADEKLKAAYVFQMFDFDEDEAIGFADLEELVRRLTSSSKNSGLINPAFRSESDLARSSSQGKRIEKAVHEDALPKETLQKIVEQVLSQSVMGKAKEISYQEFVHLTSKLPDFASAFTIHF